MQHQMTHQQWALLVEALTADQVAMYGRKSTKNESSSKSLEDQRDCCLEQAHDFGIPATEAQWMPEEAGHGGDEPWAGFAGSGLPGDTTNKNRTRPVFTRIMTGVLNGTIKCILCYSLDRLWRSAIIAGIALDILKDKNVVLADRNGILDIWSAEGRQFILSNAVQAQGQREHSVHASPRGVRKSRDKGKLIGNANSLGFRAVGNKTGMVRFIDEEIAVVQRIFRLWLVGENGSGPMSVDQIAELLQSEGFVWTPDMHERRSIKRTEVTRNVIYPKQIRFCLKDVRYVGKQRHEGKDWDCKAFYYNGKPLIDETVFQAAQDKFAERATGSRSQVNRNALSGRVRCGFCAQPLAVQTNVFRDEQGEIVGRRRFWLRRVLNGGNWCTHCLPSVRVDVLDEYIRDELAPQLLAEIEDRENASEVVAAEAKSKAIHRELDKCLDWLENKYPRLIVEAELNDESTYDKRTLTRTACQVREKMEQLRAELRAIPVAQYRLSAATDSLQRLGELPEAARRDALRSLIRWIAVFPSQEGMEKRNVRNGRPAHNVGILVFLTSWGSCFCAQIYRDTTGAHMGNCHLLRPAPLSDSLGGVGDFPDPEAFYRGLERSWLGRTYEFNPRDVCPGYTLGEAPKIMEIDDRRDEAA